jgi:hypothetical protein
MGFVVGDYVYVSHIISYVYLDRDSVSFCSYCIRDRLREIQTA